MTQSNSVPSPPKRERYAASNTHRHHTLLNMTQKTSSELFKEILSPEILLERLPNVVENAPEPNCPYKPTCSIREEYGRPIYGVAFNSVNRSQPSDPLYFATVSGHYVTVYQCHLKDVVEDASSVNNFRGGSIIPPHQQIIAVAGKRGVIRILCPSMLSCLGSLVGHGGSINELEFHPKGLSLLFSFSKG
ncbi:unnamed protein product [Trichobilharzia regenti]|nr:unnamed protein product [Trichobilharzia regenti]